MNKEIITNIVQNPYLIIGALRQRGLKINQWYHKRCVNKNADDFVQEDWDNLIILDGCRYDTFSKINTILGNLEYRCSPGSTSSEFLTEMFASREIYDTVYVTANPYIYLLDKKVFYDIVDLRTEWDDDLETVPPDVFTNKSIETLQQYQNKRYIFHYMQPHYPFIGPKGLNINHRGFNKNVQNDTFEGQNIWKQAQYRFNEFSATLPEIREAYRENLQQVLQEVVRLLDELDGKTVITADHGNLIGDRLWPIPVKGFGHPARLQITELTKVPWHIIHSKSRREIVAESPIEDQSDEKIDKQLKALGYV